MDITNVSHDPDESEEEAKALYAMCMVSPENVAGFSRTTRFEPDVTDISNIQVAIASELGKQIDE